MKLVLTRYYEKREKVFVRKHPELRKKYAEILEQLAENYKDSSLRLHKLKGDLKKFWAVSVTYKYRIVLLLKVDKGEINLLDIGSHDEAY